MANYPFKINIVTKDGTKSSFFDADLVDSDDLIVSSSAMVTKINAMVNQTTFIDTIEDPGTPGSTPYGSGGGSVHLALSHTNENTGSIVFTDTEITTNGGLDYYTFWGTKVCSVLGLPEGIPIYSENFKFSDSSTGGNYMSGDVIADGIAVKKHFKMSSQARVKGNLVWDEVFGEGLVQWASGSNTRMLMGYDNLTDTYKINAPQISGSRIQGSRVSTSDIRSHGNDSYVRLISFVDTTPYQLQFNPGGTDMDFYFLADTGYCAHFDASTNRVGINKVNPLYTLDVTGTLNVSSNITTGGTVDGRDVATDGTKLDGIEASADVTDATNVTAAGALMDSELSSLSDVKAINQGLTTTSTPQFTDLTITGDIDLNGDLVGDAATDITGIESINCEHVRAYDDPTNNYIDLDDNDIRIVVNNTEIASFEDNAINFNDTPADVNVRMEVSAGSGMVSNANAFFLDSGLGILGIGNAPTNAWQGKVCQMHGDIAGSYVLWINNGGGTADSTGILIQCGTDDNSGTNTAINFTDGDGTSQGTITFSGGTVSYNHFTGAHPAYIMESDSPSATVATNLPTSSLELYYEPGTIVSMVSSSYDGTMQPVSFVVSSSAYQDKRAFGVYAGSFEWGDGSDDDPGKGLVDKHLISALGDGYVFVNNQNGDIEIGDYITTASGSGGYGCKQSDDILHNYTVAKSTDSVTWSNESITYKLIACTYHCG